MEPVRLHPRVHRISPPQISTPLYVLREDEMGFAVAGGKRRKYAALIPWLQSQGIQQVAVIGSLHSNNVLAAAQLLTEAGISLHLFLKSSHHSGPGNAFLTELLVPKSAWTVVESADWPQVNAIAQDWTVAQSRETMVLPEGAFCEAAFWGTTGLALDIAEREQELGVKWERIFVDAGTGLSAAGLIWGGGEQAWKVEVIGMALDEAEFKGVMEQTGTWSGKKEHLPYDCHTPHNAHSFGAVNQTVRSDIVLLARTLGILTDPIYSVKLFREAFRILRESPSSQPSLIVHSGGANTLPGFFQQLEPHL